MGRYGEKRVVLRCLKIVFVIKNKYDLIFFFLNNKNLSKAGTDATRGEKMKHARLNAVVQATTWALKPGL